MNNKKLALETLEDMQLSINTLTDNFSDFDNKEKLLSAIQWNGFLIGELNANLELLKQILKTELLAESFTD